MYMCSSSGTIVTVAIITILLGFRGFATHCFVHDEGQQLVKVGQEGVSGHGRRQQRDALTSKLLQHGIILRLGAQTEGRVRLKLTG